MFIIQEHGGKEGMKVRICLAYEGAEIDMESWITRKSREAKYLSGWERDHVNRRLIEWSQEYHKRRHEVRLRR